MATGKLNLYFHLYVAFIVITGPSITIASVIQQKNTPINTPVMTIKENYLQYLQKHYETTMIEKSLIMAKQTMCAAFCALFYIMHEETFAQKFKNTMINGSVDNQTTFFIFLNTHHNSHDAVTLFLDTTFGNLFPYNDLMLDQHLPKLSVQAILALNNWLQEIQKYSTVFYALLNFESLATAETDYVTLSNNYNKALLSEQQVLINILTLYLNQDTTNQKIFTARQPNSYKYDQYSAPEVQSKYIVPLQEKLRQSKPLSTEDQALLQEIHLSCLLQDQELQKLKQTFVPYTIPEKLFQQTPKLVSVEETEPHKHLILYVSGGAFLGLLLVFITNFV
jgi:hypothetical protein